MTLCHHPKSNGQPCASPAVTGQTLCFFHARSQARTPAAPEAEAPLHLPALDSPAAVLAALSELTLAIAANTIDLKRANLLLRALSLATRLANTLAKQAAQAAKAAKIPATAQPLVTESIPTTPQPTTGPITQTTTPSVPFQSPDSGTWVPTESTESPTHPEAPTPETTATVVPETKSDQPKPPAPTHHNPNDRLPRSLRERLHDRHHHHPHRRTIRFNLLLSRSDSYRGPTK